MSLSADAEASELLWTVAVARILLGPEINLQVPPNLSQKDYHVYLDAGINDWGGVSPLTIDYVNPEAPWPGLADLRDRTRSMGFELRPSEPGKNGKKAKPVTPKSYKDIPFASIMTVETQDLRERVAQARLARELQTLEVTTGVGAQHEVVHSLKLPGR